MEVTWLIGGRPLYVGGRVDRSTACEDHKEDGRLSAVLFIAIYVRSSWGRQADHQGEFLPSPLSLNTYLQAGHLRGQEISLLLVGNPGRRGVSLSCQRLPAIPAHQGNGGCGEFLGG